MALRRSLRNPLLWAALLAGATHLPVLWNDLVWDDAAKFARVHLEHAADLTSAFSSAYWDRLSHEPREAGYYRPVASLVFGAITRVCGLDPRAFHLLSLALHMGVTALVVRFSQELRPGAATAATMAGLLFATHPVHTETVAFASDATDLLMAVAYLGATILGMGTRTFPSVALYGFALLSKEMAITFPAVLAVLVWTREGTQGLVQRRAQWFALGLATAAYLLLRWRVCGYLGAGPDGLSWDGWTTRLSEVGRSVSLAGRLLVWPHPLIADYGPAGSPPPPSWGWSLIGVAFLGAVPISLAIARRWPLPCLAFLWFAITFLPVSNILPIPQPRAERFLYLPSAGPLALFPLWLLGSQATEDVHGDRSRFRLFSRRCRVPAGMAFLFVLCAAGGVRSWTRMADWRNERSLWESVRAACPNNPRAAYNLAVVEEEAGNDSVAVELYDLAAALAPDMERVALARARLASRLGRTEEALKGLDAFLERHPESARAHLERAAVLARAGRYGEAAAAYKKIARLNPGDPRPRIGRALCLLQLGFEEEARDIYRSLVADGTEPSMLVPLRSRLDSMGPSVPPGAVSRPDSAHRPVSSADAGRKEDG